MGIVRPARPQENIGMVHPATSIGSAEIESAIEIMKFWRSVTSGWLDINQKSSISLFPSLAVPSFICCPCFGVAVLCVRAVLFFFEHDDFCKSACDVPGH